MFEGRAALRRMRDAWKKRALWTEKVNDTLARRLSEVSAEYAAAIVLPGKHRWDARVECWRGLVDYWMRQWGGDRYLPEDLDLMLGMMARESGGDPLAVCGKEWVGEPPPGYDGTAGTRASGLFQQVPAYWESRSGAAGMGGRSIFDPDANIGVSCWLLWDGWDPAGGPHWHHWSGAHVGVEGSYEWALRTIGEGE